MKYIYQQISKKDGIVLRGVLNTPDDFDKSKKYPTVIFYHGFGGDRNGTKWFRSQNAEYLTDRGYVVFRFDFSGTNESDGDFYDMTVSREEEEAIMIYNFVSLRGYVNKDRIYTVGHSLGGVIATLIANRVNPKAMILQAPASDMNNPDYLKIVASTVYPDTDDNKSEVELLKKLHETKDVDIGGVKLHKNFLRDFFKKDIYKAASDYHGNVLIIRGSKDELVFNDANQKLSKAYPNASYDQIKGADHSFTNLDDRLKVFEMMYEFLEDNK